MPVLPALALPVLVGQVWIVDASAAPDADFVEIQDAIDAASRGDLILVREGTYERIDIAGKGLSVVAEEAGVVVYASLFDSEFSVVRELPAGQSVLLQGLSFDGLGLRVENCAGGVALHECDTPHQLYWLPSTCFEGSFDVVDCAEVFASRCKFADSAFMGVFPFLSCYPQPGASVTRSTVAFSLCQLHGDDGVVVHGDDCCLCDAWYNGAAGVLAEESTLLGHLCEFNAGHGAGYELLFVACVSDGGDGVRLTATDFTDYGSSFAPGVGGETFGQMGQPGVPVDADSLSSAALGSAASSSLAAPRLVSSGQTLDLELEPVPQSFTFLLVGNRLRLLHEPLVHGVLAVGGAPWVLPLAWNPDGSMQSTSLATPALPPGLLPFQVVLQGLFVLPSGELQVSNPTWTHLIP